MRPVSKRFTTLAAVFACLIIICAASAGALLYLQYANRPQPQIKKAFILLPGLMGSSLATPDNEVFWSADLSWAEQQIADDPTFLSKSVPKMFEYDEDGMPTFLLSPCDASTVGTDGYDKDKYGFDGMLHTLSAFLTDKYADDGYQVVTWQYDWRKSNETSALLLEDFVASNGYTDIVIISQGMGGNVAAKFLTKFENRVKVRLFVPFGAPFLGSLDIIAKLFATDGDIPTEGETYYSQIIDTLGIGEIITYLPAFAQLLPYPAMSKLSLFGDTSAPVKFNGELVSYSEIYDYFCAQDFAKTESHSLKKSFEALLDLQLRDYLKVDGTYKHITEFVNTVYVVGTGKDTRYMVDIDTAIGKIISSETDSLGDGVVWAYSATAGLALDSANVVAVDSEVIDYTGHFGMIDNLEIIQLIQPFIDSIM